MGIGDWGLGIGPNPQSPIPNPQSPIPNPQSPIYKNRKLIYFIDFNFNKNNNYGNLTFWKLLKKGNKKDINYIIIPSKNILYKKIKQMIICFLRNNGKMIFDKKN